jgi:broad specificity phosphatase PhoE
VTTSSHPRARALAFHPHLRHPANGETTLYLIRHGRTESNVLRRFQGQLDTPLDAHGIKQAHLLAARAAEEIEADVLLSSPLQRALVTAQIVGASLGFEPIIVPELSEMDFGAMEGITIDRLEAEHPEIAARMYDEEDDDFGWPEGETRRDFHGRVLTVFQTILADFPGKRVVVVAHGGVIGSFLAQIEGVSPNNWTRHPIANCSLTHLHITSQHTAVHLFNDAVHLEVLDTEQMEPRR